MSQPTLTVIRRVIVVIGLLCLGPLRTYIQWSLDEDSWLMTMFSMGGVFDSQVAILAIWFVSRDHLWDSWRGWFRAFLYASAALAGSLVCSMIGDWLGNHVSYEFDEWFEQFEFDLSPLLYEGPLPDLLRILLLIWLFMPIRLILGRRLIDSDATSGSGRIYNIRWLVTWNGIAAAFLAFLRIQSEHDRQLTIGDISIGLNIGIALLFGSVQVFAVSLVMTGLAGKWYNSILGLVAGAFIVMGGILLVEATPISDDYRLYLYVLVGPLVIRSAQLAYVFGFVIAAFFVFGLARITGLRFQRVPGREETG